MRKCYNNAVEHAAITALQFDCEELWTDIRPVQLRKGPSSQTYDDLFCFCRHQEQHHTNSQPVFHFLRIESLGDLLIDKGTGYIGVLTCIPSKGLEFSLFNIARAANSPLWDRSRLNRNPPMQFTSSTKA
ncbi:hypothetical protein PAAG_12351 [Paracoccidioides lutzii Pb01]|uniref:Uncharacterized protein n=1 Tax=Paracoccidioides lutzii (strain ATCC MYA-826 / Pb01) TaxID=502779 RepID=A0A0A2V0E0_PARBA|nr:hypothetical protein PAAG_12351 [Paracoccidioides lutzii Pb01]KGQ00978.1 hypothetical protein PAAG_12351 [Paracoccidioides lutzii Pb01]